MSGSVRCITPAGVVHLVPQDVLLFAKACALHVCTSTCEHQGRRVCTLTVSGEGCAHKDAPDWSKGMIRNAVVSGSSKVCRGCDFLSDAPLESKGCTRFLYRPCRLHTERTRLRVVHCSTCKHMQTHSDKNKTSTIFGHRISRMQRQATAAGGQKDTLNSGDVSQSSLINEPAHARMCISCHTDCCALPQRSDTYSPFHELAGDVARTITSQPGWCRASLALLRGGTNN